MTINTTDINQASEDELDKKIDEILDDLEYGIDDVDYCPGGHKLEKV